MNNGRPAGPLGRPTDEKETAALMLSGIRSAAETWLGKAVLIVLFGFLIVSFAIWGIGDIFRGYGANALAAVGRTEIGVETFRRAFQQRIYEVQQRSRSFTTEQARALGLDRQVLNQLVGETALNAEARRLGLAVTAEETARSLAANPAFRGPDGRFNRQAFDAYLRETGLTEGAFIEQQRQAALRQQLGQTLSSGFAAPRALMEMVRRYQAEERKLSYVVVPGAIASALPAPTDDQLKALHEQRKAAFRAPEYRAFDALVLTPSDFAGDVSVSEAELRQAYDRGLAAERFGAPERRTIQQIVFPTEADAAAAAERLKGGLAWEQLLEERKLAAADIDLGAKTRSELLDPAIAAAAFGLAEGGVSEPVRGPFGPVLLRVTAIEAGTAQPFEALRDVLRADAVATKMATDRDTRRKLDEAHDRIEDLRASGKTLAEVGAEAKRPLTSVASSDAQGRDKGGQPIVAIPEQAEVLRAVFQSDRGVDNEAIRTRDGGYVWFEIRSIEASRERGFDDVRTQIEELWRTEEAARLTTENANALLKRAEAGETLEALAAELGGAVETAERVTRSGNEEVGPPAAAVAFALEPGRFGIAATGRAADRMILRVDAVQAPAFDPEDAATKSLRGQIDATLSGEILDQYVGKVQSELGVTVNERALALATGAAQTSR